MNEILRREEDRKNGKTSHLGNNSEKEFIGNLMDIKKYKAAATTEVKMFAQKEWNNGQIINNRDKWKYI